jgi:dihydroorotate dehydrogenase electron transfer subunit
MVRRAITIAKKIWYTRDTFGLEFSVSGISPKPGQFFQVRVSKNLDPFLNRPISAASYNRNRLLLIIRIVGQGTFLLSKKEPGDKIWLFGPLGKSIKVKKRRSLLVAGGIGVAPLLFLAQHLKKKKIPFTFLYGAYDKHDLILMSEIKRLSNTCKFVAEHGYARSRTVLQELEHTDTSVFDLAYACGPRAMLKQMQFMDLAMPIYAFCEDFLGCGCGLCLGCAIKYKGMYKRICEDGPVFQLRYIDFEPKDK